MNSQIYAALEIGTTSAVLAVAEADAERGLRLAALSSVRSAGVRKSRVTDLVNATQTVNALLREVENSTKPGSDPLDIRDVTLVVSGSHVRADSFDESVSVNHRVTAADVESLNAKTRERALPDGRQLLDVVTKCYQLDSVSAISNPVAMSGSLLTEHALHIHGDACACNDLRAAAGGAHLESSDSVFAATCAADAVLSEEERRAGALVLDLGGGSTGYALAHEGAVVAAGAFGVGGEHVTSDIAQAFQIKMFDDAERLKLGDGCTLDALSADAPPRAEIAFSPAAPRRDVSRRALATVIDARMGELADLLRLHVESLGLSNRIASGIVLTGGGARLRGVADLFARHFNANVRVGVPLGCELADGCELELGCEHAAIWGALKYAFGENPPSSSGVIARLFRRIVR